MSGTNSSAYRSERSYHQASSSSTTNPYMEKSRGLFAEDFGSFMCPKDALGFPSEFTTVYCTLYFFSLNTCLCSQIRIFFPQLFSLCLYTLAGQFQYMTNVINAYDTDLLVVTWTSIITSRPHETFHSCGMSLCKFLVCVCEGVFSQPGVCKSMRTSIVGPLYKGIWGANWGWEIVAHGQSCDFIVGEWLKWRSLAEMSAVRWHWYMDMKCSLGFIKFPHVTGEVY